VSQGLSILALSVILLSLIDHEAPIAGAIQTKTYINLGNMLLGFVVLWSYISFSQYLVIWSGNLPEEITWYLNRTDGGLVVITFLLTLIHFLVPMILLLFRQTKKNVIPLRNVAIAVIVMRFFDVYWNIVPSFSGFENRIGIAMTFFALAATAGLGGLWLWHFLGLLMQRPLIPVHDPRALALLEKEQREASSHA
jgi:hypothetical protein